MKFASIHSFGNLPYYGKADGGGGGGPQEEGEGESDSLNLSESDLNFSDDDGTGPILEGNGDLEEDDGISFDSDDFVDNLFKKDDDDDDDNSDVVDDSEAKAAAQAKLTKDMKDAITAVAVPETAIPADFDSSDPKQLRDLLSSVQRDTVQHSMRIMWQPVAAAFAELTKNMRAEMSEAVEGGVGANNLKSLINSAIPNYSKPAMKSIVDPILNQARRKFPGDDRKAVAATRKALIGLGMRIGAPGDKPSKPGSGRGGRQSAAERTNSVLDQFVKLPARVATSDSRLQNRLQRPAAKP